MSKALIRELELRLSDLLVKVAAEERELSPNALYLEDLAITIGYCNTRLKGLKNATQKVNVKASV